MKNYDVYKISASDKVEFIGVFEAQDPFSAVERAEKEHSIKNSTMKAFVTGSDRAEKFAKENIK
jgi:hypothetical protein